MADDTHNMGLAPFFIERIFHGFAVNSQTVVVLTVCTVPLL